MRNSRGIGIGLVLLFFALVLWVSPGYAKETLRLAATTHPDHVYTKTADIFAKAVAKKTNGEIEIKVYPARQLGNEREQMEMVTLGTIAFSLPPMGIVSNLDPVWAALQLPFIYDSGVVASHAFRLPILKEMGKRLESKGVIAVSNGTSGLRVLGSTKGLVHTVEDMKGLKLRALQAPIYMDSLKAVGASPTPLPYGEIYTAIQQGVIDGSILDIGTIELGKFYEVCKYYTRIGYMELPFLILMNKAKFDSYSPSIQKAILEAGDEAREYNIERLLDFDKTADTCLKGYGCQINVVKDFPAFKKAVQWIYDDYTKKDPLIKEYVQQVEKLNKEYAK